MPSELDRLLDDVDHLHRAILNAESRHVDQLAAVRPHHRYSAANLIHYVELRQHDVRGLQDRLSQQGLSSLGGIESHVLVSVDAVRAILIQLTRTADVDPITTASTAPDGAALLARNAVSLLGPLPPGRVTRIMVTMPTEASSDQEMVRDMLSSGMDIARINCAHDGPEVWDAILANIRAAESQLQTSCLVSMDLGGPKLRTGPIRPGPAVRKIRPIRDPIGVVQEPAWVWLGVGPSDAIDAPALPVVPLDDAEWAGARRVGEKIRIVDARGSARTMTVERLAPGGCLVTLRKTTYLVPGTILSGRKNSGAGLRRARVGPLESAAESILVRIGDRIVLSADLSPAESTSGGVHRIGCTLPEVFTDARPGERVLLDDGKIGGVITSATPSELTVDVRSAAASGTKLGAEKGINLPDTRLSVSAITEQDASDLEFVHRTADIVEMSFVRSEQDVLDLIDRLTRFRAERLGIVLKIETVAGFDALPQILLEAMRWDRIGVMIARGDLAVEVGFERLSEVQEEILWVCEAAHVPVIWATEVLDSLARTGLPSRAEVTDAAMAERAECVLLNKGPYIDDAIRMLSGILGRMQSHMQKRRSRMRRLRAWDGGPLARTDSGTLPKVVGADPQSTAG